MHWTHAVHLANDAILQVVYSSTMPNTERSGLVIASVATIAAAAIGCGGDSRRAAPAPPPPTYGSPAGFGVGSAPPPPPVGLASCAGASFGTYEARFERDPQNLRKCKHEPIGAPLVLSPGQGAEVLLRPEGAPANVTCTTEVSGCTVRSRCDDAGPSGEFLGRADYELTFQGAQYTGLVRFLDNYVKATLPCSSRVLVSGARMR